MSEYIRFLPPSVLYVRKQLLQSQLESLNVLQRLDSYKKMRSQELELKVALKKKLDETEAEILAYIKLMPKVPASYDEPELTPEQKAKRQSLASEIEVIKQKLTMLNG